MVHVSVPSRCCWLTGDSAFGFSPEPYALSMNDGDGCDAPLIQAENDASVLTHGLSDADVAHLKQHTVTLTTTALGDRLRTCSFLEFQPALNKPATPRTLMPAL